tara:strand:+ start:3546 stop:4091 length:546 start_codon:yes stop_codon:yes gene_type:complete
MSGSMFLWVYLLSIVCVLYVFLRLASNRSSQIGTAGRGGPTGLADAQSARVVNIGLYCLSNGSPYSSQRLQQFFDGKDLAFDGEKGIYQRVNSKDQVVFTLASASEPGHLNLTEDSVDGLAILMSSDDMQSPADAFDQLLVFLHEFTTEFGGSLLDVTRQPLTQSLCQSYREQLLACEANQ